MGVLLQRLERAPDQTACERTFTETLRSMEKGSLKRDDFLRKLAEAAGRIPTPLASSVCEAAAKASSEYTYDTMPGFGEAGHVLRMVLIVAKRLPRTDRLRFLQRFIVTASDDTMALRVLTILTQQEGEEKIDISIDDLYPSFLQRMRARYGRTIDAAATDLSTSDPWAFDFWGRKHSDGMKVDPEDREIQRDFWLRFIGNSRKRLAEAFRAFLMPMAVYRENPDPIVENKIPLADLRRLYDELPNNGDLTEQDQKSLDGLRRLLNGEFKAGIDPFSGVW